MATSRKPFETGEKTDRRCLIRLEAAVGASATSAPRDDLADQCQKLQERLSNLDEVAFSQIAGGSPTAADQLLAETIVCFDLLEASLLNACSCYVVLVELDRRI